jgi:hypothetical protein
MTTLDRFERFFVFGVARTLPLLASIVAALGLVAGVAVGVYSILPVREPVQEAPAPPPPPVHVTVADVSARLQPAPSTSPPLRAAAAEAPARPRSEPRVASEESRRIAAAVDALRKQLESGRAPWENTYATECALVDYRGRCLQTAQRVSAQGLRRRLFQVLARYDADATEENVELADSSRRSPRTYAINPSNSETKLAVLAEAMQILAATPDTLRAPAFRAWAQLRGEREEARLEAMAAEAARVARVNAERALSRVAATVRRGVARLTSVRAIGGALAVTLVVGLMLALLAVERNTRELRRVLTQLQGVSGPFSRSEGA